VQVAFGNARNADGYASAGKAEGGYQGMGQQSGPFAGNGGYHVDAGHVNLIGGVIASTNAGNSELTAQTLTFTDLQNQMDHSASSGGISVGAGGQMTGWDPKAGNAAPRGGSGTPMAEKGGGGRQQLDPCHADRGEYRRQANRGGGGPHQRSARWRGHHFRALARSPLFRRASLMASFSKTCSASL
jgi:filamentous hemagglutinin